MLIGFCTDNLVRSYISLSEGLTGRPYSLRCGWHSLILFLFYVLFSGLIQAQQQSMSTFECITTPKVCVSQSVAQFNVTSRLEVKSIFSNKCLLLVYMLQQWLEFPLVKSRLKLPALISVYSLTVKTEKNKHIKKIYV